VNKEKAEMWKTQEIKRQKSGKKGRKKERKDMMYQKYNTS
jgi:hypothetical protein